MLAELLCIISWYNPFSWLIRYSIRQNLEFIADQQVLASGLDRKNYQYHLLKVVGEPLYRLTNNFNFSSLKKRILMMNKSRSTRLHLLKFLFIVPLLGVLLVAFRDKVDIDLSASHSKATGIEALRVNDTTPTPIRIGLNDGAIPMYVINEKEATGWEKGKLKPQDIESIDVLKNTPAFGPRGANGVILIYMKGYKITGVVTLKDGTKLKMDNKIGVETPRQKNKSIGTNANDAGVDTVGVTVFDTVNATEPLYVLDGKVISAAEASKIDPGTIAAVEVIKDQAAKAIYGSRAANGVIMIASRQQPGGKGQLTFTSVSKGDTLRVYADTVKIMPSSK
jgi:TonB-dependent SusC/RagA subfamily outer membrane receptor